MSFHDKLLSRKGRPRTTLHPDGPPSLPFLPTAVPPSGPTLPTYEIAETDRDRQELAPPPGSGKLGLPDLPGAPPYSVKALAERWNCSEGAVRKLIQLNTLRSFRIGDLIRVAAEEVARFECRS